MHEVTQMDGFTFIKRLAWLQQILHNGGCVNILERHLSSVNLMKTFVNPNVNALSLSLKGKIKIERKIPLFVQVP